MRPAGNGDLQGGATLLRQSRQRRTPHAGQATDLAPESGLLSSLFSRSVLLSWSACVVRRQGSAGP
eukprot:224833-Rhodomonas_salina.2